MGLSAGLNSFFWRYIHGSYEGASRRWGMAIFVMFLFFPGIGSGGSIMLEGMWIVALLHWFFDPGSRCLTRDEKRLVAVFAAYFLISAVFAFVHALALARDDVGTYHSRCEPAVSAGGADLSGSSPCRAARMDGPDVCRLCLRRYSGGGNRDNRRPILP